MIYLQYLTGSLVYLQLATLSYSKDFQAKNWFLPVGLALAVIANLVWLIIARREPSTEALLIKGLLWDVMLTGCYLIVPIFLGVQLTLIQIFGIILIVAGMILTKL